MRSDIFIKSLSWVDKVQFWRLFIGRLIKQAGLPRPATEVGVSDKVHSIPVHIRFDGDNYFVSDELLNLYGVGASVEEAEEDYWTAVQEYYADLSANADSLVAYLQEHLNFLRKVFAITSETT
jgi:hypothetical protein